MNANDIELLDDVKEGAGFHEYLQSRIPLGATLECPSEATIGDIVECNLVIHGKLKWCM
jgi:hypothetical protein